MKMIKGLVLGSSSKFRREIFQKTGISHISAEAKLDEKLIHGEDARSIAINRANAKALSLTDEFLNHVIIGCDQTLSLNGRLLEKVSSPKEAFACLSEMSGKRYMLHSAYCMVYKGNDDENSSILKQNCIDSYMQLRELTEEQIRSYVETGEWVGVVGCNRIEEKGMHLHTAGPAIDIYNIMGLPILHILESLREIGIDGLLQEKPPWPLLIG